ncbi:hypothetical protein ACLF3G_06990 [Falsiroseomonas sp. HC035]|uniref:hypothetical protein n=1 Tax=Falsiroseomonas sp. HC035 TaxID=3390999 RepID=UPI003D31F006
MRLRHALLLAAALPVLASPALLPREAQAQPAYSADRDGAESLLRLAREAVAASNAGRAREYLEQAETRVLTRSVIATRAGEPAQGGAVGEISAARQAVDRRDRAAAYRHIDQAMDRLRQPAPMASDMPRSKTDDMGAGGTAPVDPGETMGGGAPRVIGPAPAPMFTPGPMPAPSLR